MRFILSFTLILVALSIFSCKKERSLENSKANTSQGSLQSDATGECLPKNVQGAYIAGTTLGTTNFLEVDIEVDVKGSYFISTDTINGYYFTGSGEFADIGLNTVKLMGKGKPLAQGEDIFTLIFDSTSCNIPVTVLPNGTTPPPPTSTYFWKFTSGGITYQGSVDSADAELAVETVGGMTIAGFDFYGENATADTAMEITLIDLSGAIAANETYSSSATSTNSLFFTMDDGSGTYEANPGIAGISFTAKVISHDPVAKVIEGTFSGTVKETTTGSTKTITGGQFKVNY